MNLTTWLTQQHWTWQRLSRELSDIALGQGQESIYYNRVWRLKTGKATPRGWELKALMTLTDDEVDSFRDEVE